MTPWLSDAEIDDLCAPLTQAAAQIRFIKRAFGITPGRKPDGSPLVFRSELEDNPRKSAIHLRQVDAENATTTRIVPFCSPRLLQTAPTTKGLTPNVEFSGGARLFAQVRWNDGFGVTVKRREEIMSPLEIEVGKTYANRGKGKTHRKVIAIGPEFRPKIFWNATGTPPNPDDPGVLYEQNGRHANLYLASFAAWCGKEVTPNDQLHRTGADAPGPSGSDC